MKAVELLKPHTHAGVEHPIGVVITVSTGTADYLEQFGIGRKVSAKASPVVPKHSPIKRTRHKGGS